MSYHALVDLLGVDVVQQRERHPPRVGQEVPAKAPKLVAVAEGAKVLALAGAENFF